MSNIDRRYSYHDDGVLPSEGEYGVTYLTLYSSGAGNVYDGWMWDPDRVHYSETERTFGYRNPDYPDYCWDDEVVVDLSNAQTRQESSEFEQGRITSFNTNVSDQPILLQDIDITGLNEEEREAKATTVLFSAIPLVKDAYIHAEVEIQAKMNISPDNTTGTVRMEAFYIINNESDRTMRPNPVDHRAVCTTDERNTFRFLYWNPALKHEDHNYIGVKLLCTGGTAEIGISDDPEYGDAIITLTSAGLVGDHIDEGHPVSLDIYGKSLVPSGYKLKEADYTVLCTYDTGEVYDVSRICTYTPPMGTKMTQPTITLTAYYQGLSASMEVLMALPESIELVGIEDFYDSTYTLDPDDYMVLAYYDTGDIMDISDDEDLVYSPAMGTTINQTTTLTATYDPSFMPGSSFTDSLTITKHTATNTGMNYQNGLIYTRYDDDVIEITGNSRHNAGLGNDWPYYGEREWIRIPENIKNTLTIEVIDQVNCRKCKSLIWKAQGDISGFEISGGSVQIHDMKNFEDVQIKPRCYSVPGGDESKVSWDSGNPIYIGFTQNQRYLTSDMLKVLRNIDFNSDFESTNGVALVTDFGNNNLTGLFDRCHSITNLDFLSNWDTSKVTNLRLMLNYCINLNDISGLTNWDVTKVTDADSLFRHCNELKSAGALYKWKLLTCADAGGMFMESGLIHVQGLGGLNIGYSLTGSGNILFLNDMFNGCEDLEDLLGLQDLIKYPNNYEKPIYFSNMFKDCKKLSNIDPISEWNTNMVYNFDAMFSGCFELSDISATFGWDMSNARTIAGMFFNTSLDIINPVNDWDLQNCSSFKAAFSRSPYVYGASEYIYNPPTIDDAYGIYWTEIVNRYNNGDLVLHNFFDTNYEFYRRYGVDIISEESLRCDIPGYTGKLISYAPNGVFGGFDVNYKDGHISKPEGSDHYTGYLNIHFIYSNKLPNWYKQMYVDSYRLRYDTTDPGNTISISYV